ncbi:MAG: hypothetical protein SF028_13310 [Candidatus Sumerlaeia bacterium]|nr:hypothetical protein [Candidatus Sumerlaeia bacterium]
MTDYSKLKAALDHLAEQIANHERAALEESNIPFKVQVHVWDETPEHWRAVIRARRVVLRPG